MGILDKAFESTGGKSPRRDGFDREKWKLDLRKKAEEKYLSVEAAENLHNLKLSFDVPYGAKLERIYSRITGDLPGEDLVQWLLFLDFTLFCDGLQGTTEFEACWQVTPFEVRTALLRWYLSAVSPMSKYSWKANLPSDDPAFYAFLETEKSNLVVLYPYVFLPRDVPFLFDSSIAPPGSAKADAYKLDPTHAIASFSGDLQSGQDFAKAISNLNPLNPWFEKLNGVYYVRLPKELQKKREYNTADVMNLQVSDLTSAIDFNAIRKMQEVANRNNTSPQKNNSNSPRENEVTTVIPPTIVAPKSLEPLSVPPVERVERPGDSDSAAEPAQPECQLSRSPIDPTLHESQLSESFWRDYDAKNQSGSAGHATKQNLESSDDIFPRIGLPSDGERIAIGSGVTQKILGSGGMGVVYLTWDQLLELFRALKLLKPPPNVVFPEEYQRYRQRFLREIKIQSNMSHGNLAQIYTYGEWNRYMFFEMEYIDGVNTNRLVESSGRLIPVVAVAIMIQALQGINYAHNKSIVMDSKMYRGFIHRDIKPANIMVSKEGYVKVLDFGIGIPMGMVSLTMQHGGLVGSAPYMSPEQVNGHELDSRSDLFSIGAVFYEMLTGTSAFGNASTIHEVLSKVIEGNYKKIDSFNLKLPKSIKYIIRKSLERDPDKRFESAAAMLSLCNEALRDLTKDVPEAVIQDFVRQQAFMDATSSHSVSFSAHKKKKFLFW